MGEAIKTRRTMASAEKYDIYGVIIDNTNSVPSAMALLDNKPFDNAFLDDIKPCLLKNGVVQYYLNPDNFTLKIDGTVADITSGDDGDVMIEFPKMGYSIETIDDYTTVKITNGNNVPGFHYYAHSRNVEGDRDKLYISAYQGWVDGASRIRSLSGKTIFMGTDLNTIRANAQRNGTGYDMLAFNQYTLLQCICLIMFHTRNIRTIWNTEYFYLYLITTGLSNLVGMTSAPYLEGYIPYVKVLGVEQLFGGFETWLDGIFINPDRDILTAYSNFNNPGNNYVNQGSAGSADINGWIKQIQGTTEKGFLPKTTGGSWTTYWGTQSNLEANSLVITSADYMASPFTFNTRPYPPTANANARIMYL